LNPNVTGHRFFVAPQNIHGSTMRIESPQDVHHIRDVLRLSVGDQLVCFDGTGSEYLGTIRTQAKGTLVVDIAQKRPAAASSVTLWLAQGLPKADRFDWVVQKATELGVERVTPLLTARTVVRPAPERIERQLARWRRISREAAGQCGRSSLPTIEPPQRFDRLIPLIARQARVIMPPLAVTAPRLGERAGDLGDVGLLAAVIGPEGDFTPEEVALAQRHGAWPVSLGRLTLRSETAALVTLAILQHAAGAVSPHPGAQTFHREP